MGQLQGWLAEDFASLCRSLAPEVTGMNTNLVIRYVGVDRRHLLYIWNRLIDRASSEPEDLEANVIVADLTTQAASLYMQNSLPASFGMRWSRFAEVLEEYTEAALNRVHSGGYERGVLSMIENAHIPVGEVETDRFLINYLLFFELVATMVEIAQLRQVIQEVFDESLLESEQRAWLKSAWGWLETLLRTE